MSEDSITSPSSVFRLPSSVFRPSSPRRRAFTLIELLVVVGILGIMMGITVAAFDTIGKGAKMRSALMEIKSSLSLARQYAITQNIWVLVIFPDAYPSEPLDFNLNPELHSTRYQSYYIAHRHWTNNEAGRQYMPGRLGQWHHLPKGVMFDRDMVPSSAGFPASIPGFCNVFNRLTRDNVYNIAFPFIDSTTYTTQSFPGILFHPNGRLEDGDKSDEFATPVIFLTEGFVDINPATGEVREYMVQANATTYAIEIRPLTGRIKIREVTK